MIKKLLLSLFIIMGVSASAFAATKALLTDQVSLTANAFTTGTVDLQITTGTGTDYADTHTGFTGTLFPGQSTTKFVKLRNNGSGTTLSIQAQATNVGTGGIPPAQVSVAFTPWTSGSTSGSPETGAITTTHTLSEWATPTDLGIPAMTSGSIQYYKMDVSIGANVTTSGSSTFDFIFTGVQAVPTATP